MSERPTIAVELDTHELVVLIEALDADEYWSHRDDLPHDSGYISVIDDADYAEYRAQLDPDDHATADEAWASVKRLRALASRLNAAYAKAEAEAS